MAGYFGVGIVAEIEELFSDIKFGEERMKLSIAGTAGNDFDGTETDSCGMVIQEFLDLDQLLLQVGHV